MAERMSVLYDASKCTACQACSVACKQWNNLPAEKTSITSSIQGHADFTPKTWTFISFRESFENKKMDWLFRKEQCMHCGDAACKKACNHNAISHTDLGFVVIDKDKCIGCGYCVTNCTFHIPRVDEKTNKAYKCTGCPERVANGLKPACVFTCQPEALVYGDRKTILKMAEARLKMLQPKNPEANIYGATSLAGLNFTYVLLRKPSYYNLPTNPSVPLSVDLWKDVIRPLSGLSVAGAFLATAAGFLMTRGKSEHHDKPDQDKGADKNG
jgi:formate dehydrogenase iron-sulfur subunit